VDDHGETLGAAGGGWKVEALGQEWTLLPVTQGTKAEFSAWIRSRVRQSAIEARAECSPDDYRELLAAVNEEIASGTYSWGGLGWSRWLKQRDGAIRLARLLLEGRHRGITDEQVNEIMEANPEGLGAALAEAVRVPNPPRPVATKGSPPA
jgi:hypothetical protein